MQTFELKRKNEMRKHNRVYVRSMFPKDTVIHFRAPGWGKEQKGVLHSLSQAGVYVKSHTVPELGSRLNMRFLFGNRQVHCQGTVIYHCMEHGDFATRGFGIKFSRMLADEYALIKKAIDEFFSSTSL